MNFHGKVALITGSSSGLGAAAAELLCFLGAKVVVTGRNATRVKEVADKCRELSPYGYNPVRFVADLTIPGKIAKLVNRTLTAYGTVNFLLNNAGSGSFATIFEPTFIPVYRTAIEIFETVQVEVTRQLAPTIKSANGTIIFTTSFFARNPIASSAAYSMCKNALIAFAMTLMHEMGPNCRVNLISPTIIDGTRLFRSVSPYYRPILIANQIKDSALVRVGIPMDFAKLVAFLFSPLASFITGKEMQLDGGLSIPLAAVG